MSQTLIVELSDRAYATLQHEADTTGLSPAELAAQSIEQRYGTETSSATQDQVASQDARERFERHLGEVDLGRPTGADNANIDADLARVYADTHEGN